MEEGSEIVKFIKVWATVVVSLCYCYSIRNIVPKGFKRLVFVLPVVCLFFYLPLNLNSPHLGGTTAFFIAWLANFKILLFAFGKGPLSLDPSISLPLFIAVSCLPIKIQNYPSQISTQNGLNSKNPFPKSPQNGKFEVETQNPSAKKIKNGPLSQNSTQNSIDSKNPFPKSPQNGKFEVETQNPSAKKIKDGPLSQNPTRNGIDSKNPFPKSHQNGKFEGKKQNPYARKMKDGPLSYAIKGILLAILVHVYNYSDLIHPKIILALYAFHIYFTLELILAISAAMARKVMGIELEPQFNEPYLATSLQDFWGNRWNLMVTSILRPTVYDPARSIFRRVLGRDLATLLGVLATFLASAVMHELIFYYLGRVRPTWKISAFFVLHGLCVVVEIAVKKGLKDRWRLPVIVSRILTVGFVFGTGNWLFFPAFSECNIDVRAFEEYAALGAFMRNASEKAVGLLPGN